MKKDKYKIILILIFLFAILTRIVFISKTDIATFQFDVGIKKDYTKPIIYEEIYEKFDEGYNEGRHINYIMQLYTYGTLPGKIIGQFYHPPLHHLIMTINLKLMDLVSDSASFKFESMQVITCMYSIVILYTLYKILEELGIDDKNKTLPIGMDLSTKVLLDSSKLKKLTTKPVKTFKVVTYEEDKNELSKIKVKTINVFEGEV